MTDLANRLKGKVIAVAGGGGIGDEIARRCAAEGAAVLLGDLDGIRAQETAARIVADGGTAKGTTLDGRDEASIDAFYALAQSTYGGLDGTQVNFADFSDAGLPVEVVDLPLEVYDNVMELNARGYVLCTRVAVPMMVARGGGAITYTSSGAAHTPSRIRVAYAMSKAAGHALARHVAAAYGDRGIRANCIAPGYILHDRLRANAKPGLEERAVVRNAYKKRAGEASDIAAMAALLLSDEGAMITGQVISVDGGSSMRP